MKSSDSKKLMTYVLFLGIVALIAVYFLVMKPKMDKANAIKASNVTLQARVDELKVHFDKMNEYDLKIQDINSDILKLLDKFPADVKEEDAMVLALDTIDAVDKANADEEAALLEKLLEEEQSGTNKKKKEGEYVVPMGVNYNTISIGERANLMSIPYEVVAKGTIPEFEGDIIFVNRAVTYSQTLRYQDLLNVVKTVNNYDTRKAISRVSYIMNEDTGLLEGTMEVNEYSVLGTGKPYVKADLADYEAGLTSLFGNVKIKTISEEE